ncbi:iron-sulfur cluster carrier protein ApbC [Lysobacter sp. PAGU 2638]
MTDNTTEALLLATDTPIAGVTLHDLVSRVGVRQEGGKTHVDVVAKVPVSRMGADIERRIADALHGASLTPGAITIRQRIDAHAPQPGLSPLTAVRNLIVVGSGKGGVGKSTVAVNVAVALAQEGARVGILDADIYGPSVPTMLGLSGRPESPDNKSIEPLRAHGIEAMSIGLLVEQDTPMIWRGPMATSALTQLLNDTRWGDLDYLILDLPPGTGDIQLTLAQKIPVAGAIIVTTPQDVATLDARKAVRMLEKVNVPILGFVENMALHVCSNCGHAEHIFGEGGGARMAADYGYPLLGSLPLERGIREHGDSGAPIVAADPESAAAQAFVAAARQVAVAIARRPTVARSLSISLAGE